MSETGLESAPKRVRNCPRTVFSREKRGGADFARFPPGLAPNRARLRPKSAKFKIAALRLCRPLNFEVAKTAEYCSRCGYLTSSTSRRNIPCAIHTASRGSGAPKSLRRRIGARFRIVSETASEHVSRAENGAVRISRRFRSFPRRTARNHDRVSRNFEVGVKTQVKTQVKTRVKADEIERRVETSLRLRRGTCRTRCRPRRAYHVESRIGDRSSNRLRTAFEKVPARISRVRNVATPISRDLHAASHRSTRDYARIRQNSHRRQFPEAAPNRFQKRPRAIISRAERGGADFARSPRVVAPNRAYSCEKPAQFEIGEIEVMSPFDFKVATTGENRSRRGNRAASTSHGSFPARCDARREDPARLRPLRRRVGDRDPHRLRSGFETVREQFSRAEHAAARISRDSRPFPRVTAPNYARNRQNFKSMKLRLCRPSTLKSRKRAKTVRDAEIARRPRRRGRSPRETPRVAGCRSAEDRFGDRSPIRLRTGFETVPGRRSRAGRVAARTPRDSRPPSRRIARNRRRFRRNSESAF